MSSSATEDQGTDNAHGSMFVGTTSAPEGVNTAVWVDTAAQQHTAALQFSAGAVNAVYQGYYDYNINPGSAYESWDKRSC